MVRALVDLILSIHMASSNHTVTNIPGNLTTSSELYRQCTHMVQSYMQAKRSNNINKKQTKKKNPQSVIFKNTGRNKTEKL